MELSLCLEMLFTDQPFRERMKAASEIGYRAIEFWDYKNKDLDEMRAVAADLGLSISAFSGNRLFSMTDPRERASFVDEVSAALDAAARLDCPHLMLLSNRLREDGSAVSAPGGDDAQDQSQSVAEALAAVSGLGAAAGVTFVLEPLNTELDHPGYFLDSSAAAFEIVRSVGSPIVRVLYDIYHMAMMGEDVERVLNAESPWIGYLHVADMPGRHEPGSGTLPYRAIAAQLERMNCAAPIGMEFSPCGDSRTAAQAAFACFATRA